MQIKCKEMEGPRLSDHGSEVREGDGSRGFPEFARGRSMAHAQPFSTRRTDLLGASRGFGVLVAGYLTFMAASATAQNLDRAPIHYDSATAYNAVAELQERLDQGAGTLEFRPEQGYLKSVLRSLDVPESSQVLVFSKTSMQRERISPKTPRAIYFNDDTIIGYCVRGRVVEIATADDALGTSFYTLDQDKVERPALTRQTESCLLCHSSSSNYGLPGHIIRSLSVDRQGNPLLAGGSMRTDHASPLAERWGGWYVTGKSGKQMHLGNLISQGTQRQDADDNAEGVNVVDLKDRLKVSIYPTPHSDIVALMVLEHQVGMLNRLSRANLETRMALHAEQALNAELKRPEGERSAATLSRIEGVGDAVVNYMLFGGEAPLSDRVEGTSTFAADFAKRGPFDSKGRSLRDFDLETRLFRYPCSYLIYSRAFDSLPAEVKDYVFHRLWETLNGEQASTGKDEPRLTAEDRQAILEILRETKPGLPAYWNPSPRASP